MYLDRCRGDCDTRGNTELFREPRRPLLSVGAERYLGEPQTLHVRGAGRGIDVVGVAEKALDVAAGVQSVRGMYLHRGSRSVQRVLDVGQLRADQFRVTRYALVE